MRHESYPPRTVVSRFPEVNFLVEACAARAGTRTYGAKIHRRRHCGTVAGVMEKIARSRSTSRRNRREYSRRIGEMPDIFEGTSPGAIEFGAKRYAFGAERWKLV